MGFVDKITAVIDAVRRLVARRKRDLGSVQRASVRRHAEDQERREFADLEEQTRELLRRHRVDDAISKADPEVVRRLISTPTLGQDLTRSMFPLYEDRPEERPLRRWPCAGTNALPTRTPPGPCGNPGHPYTCRSKR
jgi:hypothetical protein